MTTNERLTRLEDAVWQLAVYVCQGEDPRKTAPEANPIMQAAKEYLGAFFDATAMERSAKGNV